MLKSTSERPRGCTPYQRHFALSAILLMISLTGCSTMGSLEPLEITLANISIPEVTVFETTLVAKLRITNPNPEALTIDGGSFKLYIEEKKIGSGAASETFTVERLDSTVVDAIFHINNASALLRLKDIFAGDSEVSYGVRGTLFTQGSFGTKKIKVEKTGRIDLREMNLPDTEGPSLIDTPPSG